MKKILITGATGFVGRQIMYALCASAVKLIPIVRDGKEDFFTGLTNVDKIVTTKDLFLEPESWWEKQCQDIDIVVHAAWYAEPGKYLEAPQNMDCLLGSINLARGAVSAGVKRIVGIGTCFEYDLTNSILNVDTPIKPTTPYSSAKAALYFSLSQWLPMCSVQFAWARLFYLYGEGENSRRLVPYIRGQLEKGKFAELTSGEQIRDFLDVREAGKRIAELTLSSQEGAVNICSGKPVTVKQLAEQIADEYGLRNLLKFGVRQENLVDPKCVVGIPTRIIMP